MDAKSGTWTEWTHGCTPETVIRDFNKIKEKERARMTKIIAHKCDICGKEIVLSKEEIYFTQIRYRTVRHNSTWESSWYDLCEDCSRDFQKLLFDRAKGGGTDGS